MPNNQHHMRMLTTLLCIFMPMPRSMELIQKKIGAEGFSGGGFVLAGLGYELAKANKSHLVHSLFFLEPMLDDTILNIDPAEASQNEEWERRYTRSLLEGHAFNLDK